MDFLKKRVKQYQEKKLKESLSKMKFHLDMKKKLEQEVENNINHKKNMPANKISFHSKMADIWKNNAEKIEKELKKIDD